MAEPQEPPIWVDELVARNEELLKAVAENQALGRLADAVAYQELFQQNVLKLATFCDLSNEVLDSGDATLGGVASAGGEPAIIILKSWHVVKIIIAALCPRPRAAWPATTSH